MANALFPVLPVLSQAIPAQKVQQHWLDGVNNLVNLELEAAMEYNQLTLS